MVDHRVVEEAVYGLQADRVGMPTFDWLERTMTPSLRSSWRITIEPKLVDGPRGIGAQHEGHLDLL
jgi:hypothetical protein